MLDLSPGASQYRSAIFRAGPMRPLPAAFFDGKPWGLSDDTVGELLSKRAAHDGNYPFCRYDDTIYTVQDIEERSNRVANGLAVLGVRRGDRVSLMLSNSIEHIAVFFALAKLGACQICMN